MRVAIIGSRGYPYVYSGYETFVRELSERLVRRGFCVTVYCHRNLFADRPRRVNGIDLVYLPTVEKKALSQFIHSLQSMLHASLLVRPQVILAVNAANGPFGIISRLFRRRCAINVDGLEWRRPKWRGLGARYFHWGARMATRWYDAVITDSQEMQAIYRREFGCDSDCIAYGAIVPSPRPPDKILEWGLASRGYYLVVGRLVPDNNGDLLVREFLASKSSKRLVIVGDVPYHDAFAEKLRKTGDPRLLFTGYVRDAGVLDELYLHCFAYLHGHEFGGTNPTLLTALACGCAVGALDTVFSREVLAGEEYGRYFSKQPGSLGRLLGEMERDSAALERMRALAPQRVHQCYTWERITDQYVDLFCRLGGKDR